MRRLIYLSVSALVLGLVACGNRNSDDKLLSDNLKKKDSCELCKSPSSRAALINASFKQNAATAGISGKKDMVLITGGAFKMGRQAFVH